MTNQEFFSDAKSDFNAIELDKMAVPLLALSMACDKASNDENNNAWGVRANMRAWSKVFKDAYKLMTD